MKVRNNIIYTALGSGISQAVWSAAIEESMTEWSSPAPA